MAKQASQRLFGPFSWLTATLWRYPAGRWLSLQPNAIVGAISAKNRIPMKWSRFRIVLFVAGAFLAGPAPPAAAANLTIHVLNVMPAGGVLRLGLYDAARYPDDDSKPIMFADVPAIA